MSGAGAGGGSDRAALLARIRAALRSRVGSEGDDSDITDLPATAFSEVPQSAVEALASRLGNLAANGQPIADLFDSAGDDAAARAGIAMINGLAQGPLAIVQQLAQVLQIPQNRAETIARNELVSSYRDAQMANYRANSDVVGSWLWSAAVASACIACVDMDGTVHSMEEDLIDHVMGRCEPLPITRTWDDIMSNYGLSADGIEETSITESYGTGLDWFASQSADVQRSILGPAKFEAWEQGDISLHDLVGVREDGAWGGAIYERSLKELGLDAQDYLPHAPQTGLGPRGKQAIEEARMRQAAMRARGGEGLGPLGHEAIKGAERTITEMDMVRIDMGNGMFTYVLREDAGQFDAAADLTSAARGQGWQNIDDVLARMRGEKPGEGELELREPKTATTAATAKTTYTEADLTGKSMADLRQIAKDAGITPARTKAETIQRILGANMTDEERLAALQRQIDANVAQRELLYGQQHDLVAEKDRLEAEASGPMAESILSRGEYAAKIDLYHQSLDKTDPMVKRYFKDLSAHDKARADQEAARAEVQRLDKEMDRLALQGKQGSAEFAQARADQEAARAAYDKANKAVDKAWQNIWTKSPGVYKPELDSIGGFENKMQRMGITFKAEDIANSPAVRAARERIASAAVRANEVKAQLKALEKPINAINKQLKQQFAEFRELRTALHVETEVVDTLRPFSDVIDLPMGRQPPNQTMQQLDYRMHEPRRVTKSRIIDDITTRLKDNPDWQEYVMREAEPRKLGAYHDYVHVYADANDTKSAKFVAEWVKRWGVGYAPGTPEWIAMQMAVRDEFGLGADIHIAASKVPAGERFYEQNGAALRALMRAMYDNTQQWFADNGITEIELYRGFGWAGADTRRPTNLVWGPKDTPNVGVTDMELNPFQSFSADINISQGTGGAAAGAGFAGGGFGGGADYSLLIGAKVPVDRILSTAQTGFGAKLESEIVVMGRATDTVAYRAGTTVQSALLREADVQAVGDRDLVYSLADGTTARVVANVDGTFTLTYQDGPQAKLGSFKVGSSKSYKTEKGVNNALKAMRFSNTYVAPDLSAMEIREGVGASGFGAADDGLAARIDSIPADVTTVADIQDWLKAQFPNAEIVDLMGLDAQTARLVANASANLIGALPEVGNNLWRIAATNTYTDALAMVPRDGLSILLNTDKWTDLASLAERSAKYAQDGWWVGETPEEIIGHEIGHALQINYHIEYNTWLDAMERVAATGGNPLVSTYAGNKVEESFAETFALVVYGEPTDAQLPIAREMAQLLSDNGIDYKALRAAVGVGPLDLN